MRCSSKIIAREEELSVEEHISRLNLLPIDEGSGRLRERPERKPIGDQLTTARLEKLKVGDLRRASKGFKGLITTRKLWL